jgi:putative ABC transport system permease protein
MKYLHLVWRNVFRKKTRMILTTSSIILVLVLIVVLTSLLQAMHQDPSGNRGSNRLVVQHATGLANFLPLSQRQRIEQIPGVVAVTPQIWFGGIYKDDRPENFFGQLSCDPEVFFSKIFDDATIDPAIEKQFRGQQNALVAGQSLVDKFH